MFPLTVISQENAPRKAAERAENWDTRHSNVPRDPSTEPEPPNVALGVIGRCGTSNRARISVTGSS